MAMDEEWASALVRVARDEGWKVSRPKDDHIRARYVRIRKGGVAYQIYLLKPKEEGKTMTEEGR